MGNGVFTERYCKDVGVYDKLIAVTGHMLAIESEPPKHYAEILVLFSVVNWNSFQTYVT